MLVRRVWPSRPTFDSPFADVDQLRREMLQLFDAAAGEGVGRRRGAATGRDRALPPRL